MTAPASPGAYSQGPTPPSVETQTVAFVEFSRASRRGVVSKWLKWGGFNVYLRYSKDCPVAGVKRGEVLVIASIESPVRFQRRGWFWRYCQLCLALVDGGLIIESVVNEELERAISERPDFVEIMPNTYFLQKLGPNFRPLLLLKAPSVTPPSI
jgi:hypothetical protein